MRKSFILLKDSLAPKIVCLVQMVTKNVLGGGQSLNTRCALHGLIYLWDLKSTTESLTEEIKKEKITEKKVR